MEAASEPVTLNPSAPVRQLYQCLQAHADPERATAMARYMKDHFAFFGIPSPQRKALQTDFLRSYRKASRAQRETDLLFLWKKPERESQYAALDCLCWEARKLPEGYHQNIRYWIEQKSWWDTVDLLASRVAGNYFLQFPQWRDPVIRDWLASGNLWVERSAILHQLNYGEQTNTDWLFRSVLQFQSSKEFFHQKAMGWALRQYAKTDPDGTRQFVEKHQDKLPALTRREALKHL